MKSLHAFAFFIISVASAAAQTNTLPLSGNVGIGTTTPGVPLQVNGGVLFDNGGAGNFIVKGGQVTPTNLAYLSNNYVTKFYTRRDANYGLAIFDQTNAIGFQSADLINGNSPQSIILNPYGGNVGIGMTSINNPAGFSKMVQIQAGGSPVFSVRSTANTAQQFDFGIGDPTGTGNNDFAIYDTTAGIWRIVIKQSSGNVGIGTTAPGSLLEMKSAAPILTLNGTDNTQFKGINFATNGSIQANILSNIQSGELKLQSGTSGFGGFITFNLDGGEKVRIQATSGNVGIGTTNPTEKLSVNGKIRAKEVIVETAGWSDYVFAKDYKLASLSEVEQHIQQQGHLPGVPSAAEVAEKGVSVGDMQALLLAKVEELTLHVIAQEKELARLRENEKEVSALRAEVQQLRQAK